MPSRPTSATSRRSASVDFGDGFPLQQTTNKPAPFRPESLKLTELDISDDEQERSPLVLSPTDLEKAVVEPAQKTQSLNLDKAPGWEDFAKEFKARHAKQQDQKSMRRSKQQSGPELSPGWDKSKHLSTISCGYEDEVWTDSDDEGSHSPMASPMPEGVVLNMARRSAKKRSPISEVNRNKVDPGPSGRKYQIDIDTAESQLPGIPTMQTPDKELGYVQRAKSYRPRSRSVDGLAMLRPEDSWLRAAEPAFYDDDDDVAQGQTDDILSLWAKRVHRLRGSFKLVGEVLAFCTALICTVVMIRVAVYVEAELKKWNGAPDNTVYYMVAMSLGLLLTLLSSMVVIAMIQKMVLSSEKWTSAFRIVADELGFLENTDETAYKLCSGLKWLAKAMMILVLLVASYESQNDSLLHGSACDADRDVAADMTWWFVLCLFLRICSTGWDVVVTCLPFMCVKRCYPEIYASQLNTEIAHSTF